MRKKHIGAATPTDFLCASPRKYRGGGASPQSPVVATSLGWKEDSSLHYCMYTQVFTSIGPNACFFVC